MIRNVGGPAGPSRSVNRKRAVATDREAPDEDAAQDR